MRDNGPIFVVDGRGGVAAVHFGFNAWAAGRAVRRRRATAGPACAAARDARLRRTARGQGGGLAFDGEGTLITTIGAAQSQPQSGTLARDVEELLRAYCGVQKVIWLRAGLVEDRDTDGHSDNIVQFVRPGVVLAQMAPDRSNPNWDVLSENRARLAKETDAAGQKLEVIEMPVLPYVEVEGERFVVPYTNYYPVNGGIVAPVVGHADDEVGFALLRELFPDREVVGAPSRLLAYGGGGIGCITQHLPAGMALAPAS